MYVRASLMMSRLQGNRLSPPPCIDSAPGRTDQISDSRRGTGRRMSAIAVNCRFDLTRSQARERPGTFMKPPMHRAPLINSRHERALHQEKQGRLCGNGTAQYCHGFVAEDDWSCWKRITWEWV